MELFTLEVRSLGAENEPMTYSNIIKAELC